MESIRGYFKALKWRSLIVAFSAILLGLLFILTPQASADVICYVAGILLLASGIAAVISYLASGRLFGSYALVSGHRAGWCAACSACCGRRSFRGC